MQNDPNGQYPYYGNGEYHPGDAPFKFPWWAILIGFMTFTPVGFVMLAVNFLSKSPNQSARRPRPAQQARAPIYAQGAAAPKRAAKTPARKPAAAADQQQAEKLSRILIGAGAVLAVVGLLAVAEPLEMAFWSVANGFGIWSELEDLIVSLVMLGGGVGSVLAGLTVRTNARMRKKIANVVGKADHMYIADIAAAIPCSAKRCIRHLENCIDKGVFGPDAYLDMRTGCLVVRGPAPQKAAPAASPAPEAEEPGGPNQHYADILRELRRVNDAIPDDEMSDKISRLEAVSARIFAQAQENPEKLPQMRKFMDYYLPTSLKLLNTYAELDAQGIEGENITASKKRIEHTMDTLVVAFENQLDQLFSADAMDVSADIEVMENMLRADGLSQPDPPSPSGPQLHL